MKSRLHAPFFVVLLIGAASGADNRPAGTLSFEALMASVATPPAPEKMPSEEEARLAYSVSDEAMKLRKAAVLEKAVDIIPDDKPSGKQSLRVDLARLMRHPQDEEAWKNVELVAPFDGKSAHFTKIMLAYTYGKHKDVLPPGMLEVLRRQAESYEEFLGTGTENHIAMQRVAGSIFGAAFPEMKTAYGISGRELEDLTLEWMPRYAKAVYATSMKEYLSMIYLGVHNEIWLTAAQYGPTENSRAIGQAMLDWIWADLAVNTHLSQTLPPSTRAKLMLDHSAPMIHPSTHAQWLAWLYWGDLRSRPGSDPLPPVAAAMSKKTKSSKMKEGNEGYQTAIIPSITELSPNEVIRNLGAKKVALPYMLLQSRAHGSFVGAMATNPFLKHKDKPEAEITRNHLRSAYIARDYSIGAGYFRKDDSGDNEQYMHLLPSAITYRSADLLNSIFVSHPYWYAGEPHGNKDEASKVFGLDCWLGKSPFEQSVHWENTVIHLFNIPDEDPYVAAAKPKEAAKWTDSRLKSPLKKVCVYVPESIDETRQTPWGWVLREGNVFISLRPVNTTTTTWEACTNDVQKGYKRLILEGSLIGLVVEVGDAAEHGTFDAFTAKVGNATPQLAGKRLDHTSTRSIPFSLQYDDSSWFPKASVKGAPLDFENWPVCESPYVTSRNGVLDVNDGKNGFTVTWQGDKPAYAAYKKP
ncbi:MAG: hypothetical protein ACO1TE_25670 [Prosthecobacter sp.]